MHTLIQKSHIQKLSKVTLYPHQQNALDKIKNGSILWGGVGSGKSITSLAYFFTKICEGSLDPLGYLKKPTDLYIITTARKRDTLEWDKECARFMISKEESISNIKLSIDSWNNIKKYADVRNAFFIFDEQRVVGYGAWSKTFIKIAKHNKWILLSATPGDTWSDYIPVFIANGFYKNKTEFTSNHIIYNRFTKFPQIDKYVNTSRLNKYRSEVLVHMPYKKHTEQIHKTIRVKYDKDIFDQVHINRWNVYEDEPIENPSQWIYTIRKVVNSDPSRIEAVKELLKVHDRIILFYNFDYELEALRTLKDIIEVAEWNGHKHEPIPNTKKWLYLVQYTAGAEGWNCTTTNAMIFFSQNYSYKTVHQSAGRIDRLNTPYIELYYYHLISDSIVDKMIRGAVSRKKTFNESSLRKTYDSQDKQRI